MIPTNRTPTHPGEILAEEFLKPMALSQVKFADHIGVPVQRINELVNGKRGVTPETAWLLSEALGTTPEFWTNLQTVYDLATHRPTGHIVRIKSFRVGLGDLPVEKKRVSKKADRDTSSRHR